MNIGVFDRHLETESSAELINAVNYNLIIGAVLLWGFAINWLMLKYLPAQPIIQNTSSMVFLIGYIVACLLGVALFKKSSNPWISFIGYNLVVVPFGLVMNAFVRSYDPSLVLSVIQVTGLVTLLMWALGVSYPKFFENIIGTLLIALLAVIVVELAELFIFNSHPNPISWIVTLIFCGYIGYDWGRANNIPRTVDNAVDSAAALYMDIIILFTRLLMSMGSGRSRK
jgi:FtsH-binding integral membrane protein